MDDLKIPRKNSDLQEFVNAKYRRFAVRYGICAAVVLLAQVGFLFDLVRSYRGTANALALAVILLIVPFFVFGGHRLVLDKEWEGKVILLDYRSRMVSDGHKITTKALGTKQRSVPTTTLGECPYCDLYVETKSGKTITHRVWLSRGDGKLPIEVGTRLRKYKGLPCPVILGNGKSECAVCGKVNSEDARECVSCGHSIIKTK